MAIEKMELKHARFPKHFHMGATRLKEDKQTEKVGKQKRVKMERRKVGMK